MQTVLNAFHKKRADPRIKSFLAHERANFICRHFVQISDEMLLCPEITRTSITALSVATRRLEWSLHHSRELTSSTSTFTSIFTITF